MKTADFESAIHRRVWDCDMRPVGQRPMRAYDASIGLWLLDCPEVRPPWHFWFLSLIHLRPIDGVRDVEIVTPGAGWEILSLIVDAHDEPDPDNIYNGSPKTPVWGVQFGHVTTDVEAEAVALACVHAIVTGKASPDYPEGGYWRKTIPEIAKHYAAHRRATT